jgi:organic hydroperoxide reductase OsmC/OhrA
MTDARTYRSTIRLGRNYQFMAEFPDAHTRASLLFDEPSPLGADEGPNAAAVVGAAVGDCLAASLAFCLQKSHVSMDHLEADVVTRVARNEQGKLRIVGIDVELKPEIDGKDTNRLHRCEELFEKFCIVTESVRHGIPVNVHVAETEAAVA